MLASENYHRFIGPCPQEFIVIVGSEVTNTRETSGIYKIRPQIMSTTLCFILKIL